MATLRARFHHGLLGAGLDDPNFGNLLRWARSVFSGSEFRHYWLLAEKDVDWGRKLLQPEDRIVILTVPSFDAMPGWIRGLRTLHTAKPAAPKRPPRRGLIQITPTVIGRGAQAGASGSRWTIQLDAVLAGGEAALNNLASDFDRLSPADCFVLFSQPISGRRIVTAPTWRREGEAIVVEFDVEPPRPVKDASRLRDLNIKDLTSFIEGEPVVRGIMERQVGMTQGEWALNYQLGSRVRGIRAENSNLDDLEGLLGLELARLVHVPLPRGYEELEYAAVPGVEEVRLLCLSHEPGEEFAVIDVEVELRGIGSRTWQLKAKV